MLALAGIAFEVDKDAPGAAKDQVEDILRTVLSTVGKVEGDPIPIKIWVAAHDNAEVRDAEFTYKDQRCRYDPEYGFTPQGRKMLEDAANAAAAQAAQEIAEQQAEDDAAQDAPDAPPEG